MITLAIAVKDPSSSRRYRQLLADSGFETIFANDVAELTRVVKARPIDAVVFDLGVASLSPTDWLEIVNRDNDLALTPVLWIGSNITKNIQEGIDGHRPGLWLKGMPNTEGLIEAVFKLIGRQVTTAPGSNQQVPMDPREWTPQDEVIDDALQIFDEGEKSRQAAGHVTAMPPGSSTQGAPEVPPSLPTDNELELEIDEVRTTNLTDPRRRRYNTGSQPRPAVVASHSPDGSKTVNLDPAMVELITNEVVDRLLRKLASKLDNDTIRKEIQAVVRERIR